MKPPEVESRLWHIVEACEKVVRVTAGKSLEEYAADEDLCDIVERRLTIAGEAVAKIVKLDREAAIQLGDYPRIIGFRNQLIRNYAGIDPDAVWVIIQRDVPILLERARALLSS